MLKWLTQLLGLRPRLRRVVRRHYLLWLDVLEDRVVPAATTTFGVIGDYGSANTNELNVANLVKSWNPDLIATLGDNNYQEGAAATIDQNVGQYYHDFIGNYTGSYGAGSAVNRFFPTLGNHDWITRSGMPPLPTPYLNYFTLPGNERYYTFTQGPVQFFMLDSGDGTGSASDGFEPNGYTANSIQGQWLQCQLAKSTAPWKLVLFHHPPYGSGNHGSDTIMQWPFQAWGASAVLSGHDHDYERLLEGGLPYFINGLGGEDLDTPNWSPAPGSQVRFTGQYGAMRVDASDTHLQFQFITTDGTLIDSYALDKAATGTVVVSSANPSVYGQPVRFTAAVTNISSGSTAVPTGTVQFIVDGSNYGAPVPLDTTGHAVSLPDTFLTGASHTFAAAYSNSDGNFIASNSQTLTQIVQKVAVEPDPENPALTDLFMGSNGTASNDQVQVDPAGSSTTGSTGVKVQTTLNGDSTKTTYSQSFTNIYIFLQGGNDHVQFADSLTINAFVSAGNGNDHVHLGNGNNVVTLGNGNDHVFLGNGNNVVTLGNGNDHVQLGNGNNVVVEGSGDSLSQVLNDWKLYGAMATNVAAIRAGLQVAYKTKNANKWTAGTGLDWFWATFGKDVVNRKSTDLLN